MAILKKYIVKAALWLLAIIALVAIYQVLHIIATAERGYKAIGGEIFVFIIPFIIYGFKDTLRGIKEKKGGYNEKT